MPIEENSQKRDELRALSPCISAAIMGQHKDSGQGTQRKPSRPANEVSPVRKSTQTKSQTSASEEKWVEEDIQAFPGNTLGDPLHSPASAETELQRSPISSTHSPKPRDYWETVLGPSADMAMYGNTNPSSSSKGEKPYRCSICPSSFKKRCNLLTHISNVHDKIRPFLCSVCYRRFARKSNCVKHVSSASTVVSYFFGIGKMGSDIFVLVVTECCDHINANR